MTNALSSFCLAFQPLTVVRAESFLRSLNCCKSAAIFTASECDHNPLNFLLCKDQESNQRPASAAIYKAHRQAPRMATPPSEQRRLRELRKYYTRSSDDISLRTTDEDATDSALAPSTAPISSPNKILTALMQLIACRLGMQRAMVSVVDQNEQVNIPIRGLHGRSAG
jgi:hypothetical protein